MHSFCCDLCLFQPHVLRRPTAQLRQLHGHRYEWQSRGSTHVHYFLWLRDAPDLSYLDEWVRETALEMYGEDAKLDGGQVNRLVERLNERAASAVCDSKDCDGGCSCGQAVQCDSCDSDSHMPHSASKSCPPADCDCRAARDANWWASRCTRWSDAWDDVERRPDQAPGQEHPSTLWHWSHRANAPASTGDGSSLPAEATADQAALRNQVNRHKKCTPYCLRRDPKTGLIKCRFDFPHKCELINKPHFYCERVKSGLRWRLYLPLNDPLQNSINQWQMASQRSNCDFKPLVDHYSALEYSVKYASKPEKGSQSMGKLMSAALGRNAEREDDESAQSIVASFLAQQVGGRDWSAQEVGHVNAGLRTVWASHIFDHVSMAGKKRVKTTIDETTPDDAVATEESRWDLYLDRGEKSRNLNSQQQATLTTLGYTSSAASGAIDPNHVEHCSFTEFWRHYHFVSNGRNGGRKLQRRRLPTVVLVRPNMPSLWGRRGHEKRAIYCQVSALFIVTRPVGLRPVPVFSHNLCTVRRIS